MRRCARSDNSAVGAQNLSVDPAAIRAGQEGNHTGDVLGLSQSLERWLLRKAFDDFLRLALDEKVGGSRSRRNGIDRDVATAQFAGQDARERLDGRLRRGINGV